MPDYQKGKIYKIYSVSNEELVYYGSTIQPLNVRLSGHIRDCKMNRNCSSKLVLHAEDYKIELVEEYPCVNKQQLLKKEGEYIKNNVCVNKTIPCRTKKEYNEIYYENNKEKLKEKKKEYYENNREHKKDYDKVYRENNKEAILEKKKEKITCECGCIINKNTLVRHQKSNKHLELIQ